MTIDRPHGLELVDLGDLTDWMDAQGLGTGPIVDVVQLTGGSQNVLLRFRRAGREYVLRRPPLNPRHDGSDTMRREARVLKALAGSNVPHAGLIAACDDGSVLGAAFYLMEPLDGFNAAVGMPALHAGSPQARHAMGLSVIEGLSRIADSYMAGANALQQEMMVEAKDAPDAANSPIDGMSAKDGDITAPLA